MFSWVILQVLIVFPLQQDAVTHVVAAQVFCGDSCCCGTSVLHTCTLTEWLRRTKTGASTTGPSDSHRIKGSSTRVETSMVRERKSEESKNNMTQHLIQLQGSEGSDGLKICQLVFVLQMLFLQDRRPMSQNTLFWYSLQVGNGDPQKGSLGGGSSNVF